jgi:hypothetical protein
MPDCSVAKPRYATDASFTNWKNTTASSMNILPSTGTVSDANKTTLVNLEKEILETLSCLQQDTVAVNTVQTNNAMLQSDIAGLKESIANSTDDIRVSEDRVKYIRAPEERTSYYESWFPLNRPMKAASVPAFLAVTLFFGLVAFFLILSMVGINVSIALPVATMSSRPSFFGAIWARLTLPFWIALAVIVGLSVYIYKSRT